MQDVLFNARFLTELTRKKQGGCLHPDTSLHRHCLLLYERAWQSFARRGRAESRAACLSASHHSFKQNPCLTASRYAGIRASRILTRTAAVSERPAAAPRLAENAGEPVAQAAESAVSQVANQRVPLQLLTPRPLAVGDTAASAPCATLKPSEISRLSLAHGWRYR
jgi:hypothetical protein